MRPKFLLPLLLLVSLMFSCQKTNPVIENTDNESADLKAAFQVSVADLADEEEGSKVVFTQVVQLEGANEVPAVITTAKGLAIIRVTANKKMYSKVIVKKLEDGDTWTASHIHMASKGVNGPVKIFLCHNAAEFHVNRVTQLTDAQFNLVMGTDPLYVNAHTVKKPGGKIRGQIR